MNNTNGNSNGKFKSSNKSNQNDNNIDNGNNNNDYDDDDDNDDNDDNEDEICLRAKWCLDGSNTIDQAIEKLNAFIRGLNRLKVSTI